MLDPTVRKGLYIGVGTLLIAVNGFLILWLPSVFVPTETYLCLGLGVISVISGIVLP